MGKDYVDDLFTNSFSWIRENNAWCISRRKSEYLTDGVTEAGGTGPLPSNTAPEVQGLLFVVTTQHPKTSRVDKLVTTATEYASRNTKLLQEVCLILPEELEMDPDIL